MAVSISDIVHNYSEKNFHEAKEILEQLHKCTVAYSKMDNLYDVEGLETIKREMTAYLETLGEHFARVKKFKTMGDYLEEHRKAIKSETISLIVDKSSLSTNQAEKVVYDEPYYKERMEALLQLKGFFNKVEIMYDRYSDTLNNIRQSISMCRKDPNFKPIEDEQARV